MNGGPITTLSTSCLEAAVWEECVWLSEVSVPFSFRVLLPAILSFPYFFFFLVFFLHERIATFFEPDFVSLNEKT